MFVVLQLFFAGSGAKLHAEVYPLPGDLQVPAYEVSDCHFHQGLSRVRFHGCHDLSEHRNDSADN